MVVALRPEAAETAESGPRPLFQSMRGEQATNAVRWALASRARASIVKKVDAV